MAQHRGDHQHESVDARHKQRRTEALSRSSTSALLALQKVAAGMQSGLPLTSRSCRARSSGSRSTRITSISRAITLKFLSGSRPRLFLINSRMVEASTDVRHRPSSGDFRADAAAFAADRRYPIKAGDVLGARQVGTRPRTRSSTPATSRCRYYRHIDHVAGGRVRVPGLGQVRRLQPIHPQPLRQIHRLEHLDRRSRTPRATGLAIHCSRRPIPGLSKAMRPMTTPMLEIRNLHARIEDREILRGVEPRRPARARCMPSWAATARANRR